MAARTVALVRVLEEREAARLPFVECRAVSQHRVVLARIRIEVLGALLEDFEREQGGLERARAIVEDMRTERVAHAGRVRGACEACDDGRLVGVGHLERRQQRDAGLIVLRRRAAVPVVAPGRPLVLAVVAVGLHVVLGERRHRLQVAERRHRAYAGQIHRRAAELDGFRIGRSVREARVMARRARHLSGRGQRRVEEHRATDLGQCGGTRHAFEFRSVERIGGAHLRDTECRDTCERGQRNAVTKNFQDECPEEKEARW